MSEYSNTQINTALLFKDLWAVLYQSKNHKSKENSSLYLNGWVDVLSSGVGGFSSNYHDELKHIQDNSSYQWSNGRAMFSRSEQSIKRVSRASSVQQEKKDRWVWAHPYLAATCIELYGCEEGVKDHVARLDVDWWLPLSHRAKIPGRVDEPPEGRHCSKRENKGLFFSRSKHVHWQRADWRSHDWCL